MKIQKIKDGWGTVRAYRLGNWYLHKKYGWGNTYSWVLVKDDYCPTMDCEFWRWYEESGAVLVNSCSIGKRMLAEKAEEEKKGADI